MPKGYPREPKRTRQWPQLEFGRKKPKNLKPLTEAEIAAKVANHLLTVGAKRLPQGSAANTVVPPVHFRVMG